MQSLGRGKGFTVTGEYSALDDDSLTSRIARRLHTLHNLVEGAGPVAPVKKNTRLQELEQENWRLEDIVEELEDEVSSLKEQLKNSTAKIKEYERGAKGFTRFYA